MMRSLCLAALLAGLALPAAAQDKVVHVFNWSDYIDPDTAKKFEAATGIKVVYDVYDSNETLETKLLTGNSGYDVVVPSSNFLKRQVAAGVFKELDKDKLPNLKNMDPGLMGQAALSDPDNAHSVVYMWGTIGIGYNEAKIKERLGEDAPTDSWALIFDPKYAAKLKDCGITVLDSPTDMLQTAMAYLGIDPTSEKQEDLTKAADAMTQIRPYIRYFHSSQYISDLANGEVCASIGFSGDVFQAASRAEEAGNGISIAYTVPKEGAQQWFDLMAIPADAPNPEAALAWINFNMEPEIAAANSNFVSYANANSASWPLIDPAIRDNPSIFPPAEVQAKLFPAVVYDQKTERLITKLWTKVKTGK